MNRLIIDLTEEERRMFESIEQLPPKDKKMIDIILKIGASHILSDDEFHTLIQNLMHEPT